MPKDRKFVNPLTQPSKPLEADAQPATYPATEPITETSTLPDTYTSTYPSAPAPRKRGDQAFEKTHERVTLWLDKGLKRRFEALATQGFAKSTLLDEAITDLLKKYQA